MPAWLTTLLNAAFGDFFKSLFARWFPQKDPATEGLKHEVEAQRNEARNLATPAPDSWKRVSDEL